jgi:hypothetical protein
VQKSTIRGPSPPRPPRAPTPSLVKTTEQKEDTKFEEIIPITPEQDSGEINPGSSLSVKERLKLRMESKKQEKEKGIAEVDVKKEITTNDIPPLKPQRKPSLKDFDL